MRKLLQFAFGILLLVGFQTVSAQQKFGFMNSGNFLESFPEVRKADSLLVLYQDTLSIKGKSMIDKFEKDYQAYIEEANKGMIPPVQAQQKEAALQKQNEEIEKYRTEMNQKLDIRRQTLLRPILTTIDTAVKAVGKEGGYTFIFDTSTGAMLFAIESEDVTAKVKAKLGLK
jgi:outer membrane protein